MRTTFLDQIPVRLGTPQDFARVADALRNSSYNEETICSTFKLAKMSEVGVIDEEKVDEAEVSEQLRLLLRLFLVPTFVKLTQLQSTFDQSTIDAFVSLGLIGTGEFGVDDEFYARVFLYPVAGFFIASDRHSLPDGSVFTPPPDIVFPAIFGGTLQFLKLLPPDWRGAALDLCSGSGIGALSLSRSGRKALASDITERASLFSRFNCALNDVHNVEVVCGDLYEPIKERRFGCVVAHPPYVPSIESKAIWRDGGTTGDSLVKRIVEQLPQHLEPGGFFFCICLGADTEHELFEERVRSWLGNSANEFDIIFAYREVRNPEQVLENLKERYSDLDPDLLLAVRSEYQKAGVVKMPVGALYLRRTSNATHHQAWNVRKQLSDKTVGADFQNAFLLHDRLSSIESLKALEHATPRLAPALEVKVTHVVHEGSLVPAEFLLEVDEPFEARAKFENWMVSLLIGLDGRTTLAHLYEEAQKEGHLPEDFTLQDLALLIARTLERGFTLLE